jgi:Ca-activated chloride channel family protein
MPTHSRRNLIVAIVLFLLVLVALLWTRCAHAEPSVATPTAAALAPAAPAPAAATVATSGAAAPAEKSAPPAQPEEKLTPATIRAPASVVAGSVFRVEWIGPNNPRDYLTVVPPDAPDARYDRYVETKQGPALDFTAPIDAGDYEIRYVAERSKKVLGRAALKVQAATATLSAADTAVIGTTIPVNWTGPNNLHDYVTVVPKGTPDGHYENYTETARGSPLQLALPVTAGDAELRYMTGDGNKVLGRRAIRIEEAKVTLQAADQVTAGTVFKVEWTGPNNPHDYVTVVPKGTPDGQYRNYTDTARGPVLDVTAPVEPGEAELRYMTGAGSRVLARRLITVVAATVSLDAPAEAVAGASVRVAWTGPNNRGDYITIVRQGTPDGQYARYQDTSRGSPAQVEAPMDAGPAEIRYVAGQGAKVLARRSLKLNAAKISLNPPTRGTAGTRVAVEWAGPNNRGDYLTIVPKSARDGAYDDSAYVNRGSPSTIRLPKEAGPAEVRYISGQEGRVLARADIEVMK